MRILPCWLDSNSLVNVLGFQKSACEVVRLGLRCVHRFTIVADECGHQLTGANAMPNGKIVVSNTLK